jgi:hypothetical protein
MKLLLKSAEILCSHGTPPFRKLEWIERVRVHVLRWMGLDEHAATFWASAVATALDKIRQP